MPKGLSGFSGSFRLYSCLSKLCSFLHEHQPVKPFCMAKGCVASPRAHLLRQLITVIEIECSHPRPEPRGSTSQTTRLAASLQWRIAAFECVAFVLSAWKSIPSEVLFGVRRSDTNRCHLVCMKTKASMLSHSNEVCA